MSLINDALKQASRAQKERTGEPPRLGQAMRPVDTLRQHNPVGSLVPWLVIGLLVLGGIGLLGFWWLTRSEPVTKAEAPMMQPAPSLAQAREPVPEVPAPMKAPAAPVRPVASTPAASITPSPPPKPEPAPVTQPATAARATPPVAAPIAAIPEKPDVPEPVLLHLQGIFYRPSKPSAVINDRTMYVGDTIGEAKVIAIEPALVKVEVRGEVIALKMK